MKKIILVAVMIASLGVVAQEYQTLDTVALKNVNKEIRLNDHAVYLRKNKPVVYKEIVRSCKIGTFDDTPRLISKVNTQSKYYTEFFNLVKAEKFEKHLLKESISSGYDKGYYNYETIMCLVLK